MPAFFRFGSRAMKSVRFCLAVCLALSLLFSFSAPAQAEPSPEGFEWVIEPRFDLTPGFAANGLAVVRVKDKWGYIRARTAR
jgi:hypothetical protein